MAAIRILPEILSNKIAAGEVVERPASVVKELVENAIDAGSTQIDIEVEKGGRALLRVSDNGSGMRRDDALLAIERYATSKIYSDKDLFAIQTLGFRGEALPSIASVSGFTLNTRCADCDSGTEIRMAGGKIKNVLETGSPQGTVVTVRELFYNVPARRKFMKSVNTEMSHIADTVAAVALGWPAISFRLRHNGRVVKSWPRTRQALERAIDVLGAELGEALHAIDFETDGLSLCGWIASPRVRRSTSRKIFVYVNGRFVRDRMIQQALFEGYRGRLMKGRYPAAVLFLRVPFDRLDVNVHPTKHAVQFSEQERISAALQAAVTRTLRHAEHGNRSVARQAEIPEAAEPPMAHATPSAVAACELRKAADPAGGGRGIQETQGLWENTFFSELKVIGQLQDTYILCGSRDGLVLIDQHAAHERIVYEQLKKKSGKSPGLSQKLLMPETVELGYREADGLQKIIPDLKLLGLEIEPFGGNTFVVKSVPAPLADRPVQPLVIEMAEKMAGGACASGLADVLEECLILMACHGAIRARQSLSEKQMTALLAQLGSCENASHCPHGRPTRVHWDMAALAKAFGRTG